jgi:hypothetical protein
MGIAGRRPEARISAGGQKDANQRRDNKCRERNTGRNSKHDAAPTDIMMIGKEAFEYDLQS